MQKGNNSNALQEAEASLSEARHKRDYSDNIRLLRIAQGDGEASEEATEKLVIINTGLVRSIALRFRERGVDIEDLMQIGTMGLLKAIRSFDLERGNCFSTYAVPLIFGELRRCRRDEGPIKVGRYYKRLGAELLNVRNRITAEAGRDPAISELASLCSVSVEEAVIAMEATSPIMSLSDSAYGDEDGVELSAVIPDEESLSELEAISDRIAIEEAMSKMDEQWRRIIILRYYRNMTQHQTAVELGLTQVKVSREEKKIIEYLRAYFV